MPPSMENFPLEVQEAFNVYALLSDQWGDNSGYYHGKDWSNLQILLDEWNVKDRKTCIYFIKQIEYYHTTSVNEQVKRQQEAQARKMKSKVR